MPTFLAPVPSFMEVGMWPGRPPAQRLLEKGSHPEQVQTGVGRRAAFSRLLQPTARQPDSLSSLLGGAGASRSRALHVLGIRPVLLQDEMDIVIILCHYWRREVQ